MKALKPHNRADTLPARHRWVGALVFAMAIALAAKAGATIYPTLATDVVLLRSDTIVFGTVDKMEAVAGQPGLFTLVLREVDQINDRLHAVSGSTLTFQVRGVLDPRRRLHINHDIVPIELGERYLINLHGGAWSSGPFARHCPPVNPVRHDGVVTCAGGEIYGIGTHGLICSTQSQQVGRPLTAFQLAQALRRALDDARIRRPDEVRRVQAETQPLSLDGRQQ